MKRIKKGDTVIVTAGKSKNHVGKVLRVVGEKLVVEGANVVKKHVKPNPQINQKGGIIAKEAPLDASNVALYNPATKKADKVGFKFLEKDGNRYKVRYFKSNDEVIDLV
ncbi:MULTISPECIES: 50S ribosomal protein L24 [Legionella]|uniref:Large ribosomal subunit protein uL24 n=1 Tax=Legionella septentrionalis TaxID=2498109 RepID=A0A3S0VM50_9GAMM|nr:MULTISPECIES: 50S ribosomal protein L24 [Legionella]MCP0913821.1 50S ribosomal protein L24 [Legionella sp. 27cVA30]RUQ81040.1 50S ribosomal protein L24 [Legionella septentrionalis]RUQ98668.1 50S ribosomal protein L24 [Legionella septentrionalis]RUR09960.1 50S ribosomal protein L24 [Legionella septentrionalis]RUR14961.1 50S ribosomal protein L24 [Legionella septentrionalis]